ncbi:MAG: hypothetical protein LBD07_06490, partial [Spirochaetaceae bacterium]|nr:hypothetical protein [Spirochaetaceae bacterium]
GIISGTAIAFILNKLLADKVKDKTHRIGLKAVSYIICGILGMVFAVIGSLRPILDTFMQDRIALIEVKFAQLFPDSNVLEMTIDAGELTSTIEELRQTIDNINTNDDSFLEKVIYNAFLNKLMVYVNAAGDGINTLNNLSNENGLVTVKSVLYGLKDMALETVSPYFIFGQIGMLVLLLIFIGIYTGVAVYFIKGGAMYNKSIVFGDIAYNKDTEKSSNKGM